MESPVVAAIIGVVLIVLGVMNLKGNISTLHSYHRKRVSEEDRLPYGRKVGTGTIIVGCAIIVKAATEFAGEKMKLPVLITVGTVLLAVGLVVGIAIITAAMIKYNKGVF